MAQRNRFVIAAAVAVSLAAIAGSTLAACRAQVETAATGASGSGGAAATGGGGARATGGGGSTVDAPCQGPNDCDNTSYCLADDQDCGPGHCVKRPPGHGDPSADFYCGCDGVVYGTPDHAHAAGFDVGNNTRCVVDPGDFFPCGPRAMCRGSGKCCGSDAAACSFQYYCQLSNGQASPVGNCGKAILEPTGFDPYCGCDLQCLLDGWCNSGGVQPPFTSVTCQELCNGEYLIDCKN
jgi:hypothetical protein